MINCGLENVTLGHLSKENNFPELALNTVYEELAISNYSKNDVLISVAKRDMPSEVFTINHSYINSNVVNLSV